eukprot:CAMPEP_0201515264 /NCGR_PEP_ID=MMETSP0161_2-20130828/6886_1 /ASSEMBLY_ACC=CAM_ASM_000251 /TAXON_ID=180227 /ORGANISM="Neoparamoeba aestuarina, Strain SoJaBio B1-5/56/2" /LENGTH=394 /DNA_ID=CAMNT_0047912053 /DNA_START=136 /DNA_END=1317 /DNA_ORIENTATION=+
MFPRFLARAANAYKPLPTSAPSLSSSLSSSLSPSLSLSSRHLSLLSSSSLPPPPPSSSLSLPLSRSFSSSSRLLASADSSDPLANNKEGAEGEEWSYTPRPEGKVGSQVVVDGELVDVENIDVPVTEVAERHWYDYPLEGVENLMLATHDNLDVSWVTTIFLATCAVRTVLMPLVIKSTKAGSKLKLMSPELDQIKKKYGNANTSNNTEMRNEIQQVMQKHGVTPFSPFMGMLVQFPIIITFFVTLRRMATEIPSFADGGYLWFTDLSVPDPDGLMRLPLLASFSTLMAMELSFSYNKNSPALLKNIMRGVSMSFVVLTRGFPQAIHVYWISSAMYSVVQTWMIHNPSFRKMCGIVDTSHLDKKKEEKPIRYAYDPERLTRKGKGKGKGKGKKE